MSVNLNGKQVAMEIDTGSAVSIMPESKFKEISSEALQESTVKLYTYSGEQIGVKGEAMYMFNTNISTDGIKWGRLNIWIVLHISFEVV